MINDYIIAIPSYKRPGLCRDKTLTMLRENNIPRHMSPK